MVTSMLLHRLFGVDGDSRRERRTPPQSPASCSVDARIAALATRQDGVVQRAQLIALGLSAAAIDHRVRTGKLIVVHRAVYAVGHAALSDRGRLRAALMAGGPTATISHRPAAALHGLLPSMPSFAEVTVTRRGPRSRPGLVIHATRTEPDLCIVDGLRVTAPLRTLRDLARAPDIDRLCAEALVLKLVTQQQLDAAAILPHGVPAPTRSALERRFLALMRNAGLPRPRVNAVVDGRMVDFSWPAERVIAETDGWAAHGHRAAFERDRGRDADLISAGWLVLRFTWRQLRERPAWVTTRVAQALAQRRATLHALANTAGVQR
jgi:very-short-patch-repair endonuclease